MLKSLPPFEHWLSPELPEEMSRWVARADRQELMSLVVAGLWRLLCHDPADPAPPGQA